jgi:mRNA interferase HigB
MDPVGRLARAAVAFGEQVVVRVQGCRLCTGAAVHEPKSLFPEWEHATLTGVHSMRIIARNTLRDFWKKHADAECPLRAWFAEASRSAWRSMADIKKDYATASIIDSERVVFNVGGNKFRLVTKIWFSGKTVRIKFIGTHESYNRIDARAL